MKETKPKNAMTPRQKQLFWIIMLGAFFEGFDDAVINIALPYISKTFSMDDLTRGYVLSIIAVGTVLAFAATRLADNLGRRPVFLWCVYGYSLCSLISAFAPALWFFVIFQFIARIFLIGCWSVGYIILSEEFKAENRGWAAGRFQLMAVFGALLVGILLPVVMGKGAVGEGWRILFAVGALPLIPVFLLRHRLPETEAFLSRRRDAAAAVSGEKTSFFEVWQQPYRKYLIVMGLVWVFLYFGIKGQLNFFTTRVVTELGWEPKQITIAVLSATVLGIFIIALNGRLLDILGRKKAALLIILVGVVTGVATFMSTNFYAIIVFNVVATGCLNSFLIVGSTLTSELFPTRVRSTAMAWANNIFGRIGQIIVPSFVGILSFALMTHFGDRASLGHALSIAMLMPLISLALILFFLPETKNRKLTADDAENSVQS
jgi:putative MFS transporter